MKVMYIYVNIVNQTERIFIWICIICRQATCNVSYCGSLCMCGYPECECNQQKLFLCITRYQTRNVK